MLNPITEGVTLIMRITVILHQIYWFALMKDICRPSLQYLGAKGKRDFPVKRVLMNVDI